MSSLRSWLRTGSSKPLSKTPSRNGSAGPSSPAKGSFAEAQEMSDLEHAMIAAGFIMNDDIEGAEERLLQRKQTTFHQLGLGMTTFMKSVLGFEKEIMAEAASRLSNTESRAWNDMKKAQKAAEKPSSGGYWSTGRMANEDDKKSDATKSSIYPPGSEYALIHAEAQLMGAVVAIMHESITEALKGFYKMRKAYQTLDGIMEAEAQYVRSLRVGNVSAASSASRSSQEKTLEGSKKVMQQLQVNVTSNDGDEDDFVDAAAELEGADLEKHLAKLAVEKDARMSSARRSPPRDELDVDIPLTSTTDIFIHSGANMCYGFLNLIISMVPPAFSKILYMIGFKGDRARGVRMLWKSTKFPNVNGAVAAFALLAYYNGMLGLSDILPSDQDIEAAANLPDADMIGYPRERCRALLVDMRARYPNSRLWKLEESRVFANMGQLDKAIELLRDNGDSKMRQVAALNSFELSLNAMYAMQWPLMKDGFLRCVELNDWSHAMYYYTAGCAELEMYRDAYHAAVKLDADAAKRAGLLAEADKHKKLAQDFFRKTPTVAGRKRFMARQMPFETFVTRKLQKWEARALAMGPDVDLADVVGPCAAMEMVYLWNGVKRLPPGLLERARGYLSWDRCTAGSEDLLAKIKEDDEVAVVAVVEAAILRAMGRPHEAREVIKPVMDMDKVVFKGSTRDDYTLPAAHYEMAAVAWLEASEPKYWPAAENGEGDASAQKGIETFRRQKTDECEFWLNKVAKWDTFVLDARFGMRVQTGLNTIQWVRSRQGWE